MEIEQLQDGIYDMVVPTPIMEPDKPIFLKRRSTIVTKAPPKISKKQIRANLLAHEIEYAAVSTCRCFFNTYSYFQDVKSITSNVHKNWTDVK